MKNIKDKKCCKFVTITALASLLSISSTVLPAVARNTRKSYSGVSTNHAKCLKTYHGKEIQGHKVEVKGENSGKINITKTIIIPLTIELSYAYDFSKNTLNVDIINSPVAYDKVWREANKIVDSCR